MNIKEKLGRRIFELRSQKGYSQEKLALIAGIDRTYLPGNEKGIRNVSITTIEKLANALEISIEELFKKF
jgi:transcriptional regulator with XRE-family HTH domain